MAEANNKKYLDSEGLKVLWNLINSKIDEDATLQGYLFNGKFYTDSTYTKEFEKSESHIYIDKNSNGNMYTWNGSEFVRTVKQATDELAGIMKLYGNKGVKEDGTMTQKAISDNLDTKVEAEVDEEDELLTLHITL